MLSDRVQDAPLMIRGVEALGKVDLGSQPVGIAERPAHHQVSTKMNGKTLESTSNWKLRLGTRYQICGLSIMIVPS